MRLLEIKHQDVYINLDVENPVEIEALTKENLMKILENIYNDKDVYEDLVAGIMFEDIKNPVKKVIAEQIINKLNEFRNSAETLKVDIESRFPPIDDGQAVDSSLR